MTFRGKLADWLTGGDYSFREIERNGWQKEAKRSTEAAELAAIEVQELERLCDVFSGALQAVIAARNITEARKIAQDALSMDDGDDTPF